MVYMEKSYLYDELFQKANVIMEKYNPCQFDKETSLCIRDAKRKEDGHNYGTCGCCRGCNHFEKGKGCTVKALSCKAWLCITASKNLQKKELRALEEIEDEAERAGIYCERASKERALRWFE